MSENNITTQLRDIKPLMEIPDISFYLYWGIISGASVVLLALLWWIVVVLWKRRKVNHAKAHLQSLKLIDWSEPKKGAYQATFLARALATDEEREKHFEKLEAHLVRYKYRPKVEGVDEETMALIKHYIEVCDGSI
jgi:hypothetical protein